jgi:hypothetical protein
MTMAGTDREVAADKAKHTHTQHKSVYVDYAHESEAESLAILAQAKTCNNSNSANNNNNNTVNNNSSAVTNDQNFPVKLHYMLSDMEADGLAHIVSWQPHGRSFTVHKPAAFVEQILPL